MKRLALFASGSGTNAENIIKYFKDSDDVRISLLISNNASAYALERARKYQVPTAVFSNKEILSGEDVLLLLKNFQIDHIVLAGFLRKIPVCLLKEFENAIINIHPALLPKYGGKGMFGMNVHEAVIKDKQKRSGISIHLVNEKYDDGQVLFQAICPIEKDDTADILASKIHSLEHTYFPGVIEDWVLEETGI